MKYLLKNGTVVSGSGMISQDVLIDGEKIVMVGENLSAEDAEEIGRASCRERVLRLV